MCRINDPLGDSSKANCVVLDGGLIYQTRPLKRGEELFMSYGPEYDWDAMKTRYLADSLQMYIGAAGRFLEHPLEILIPVPAAHTDLATWRQSRGITKLLVAFLDHDEELKGMDTFPLPYYPAARPNDLEQLELLLRSKHFLAHYGFKGTHRRREHKTMAQIFEKVKVTELRSKRVSKPRLVNVSEDLLVDPPSYWLPLYGDPTPPAVDSNEADHEEPPLREEDIPLDPLTPPLPLPLSPDSPVVGLLNVLTI